MLCFLSLLEPSKLSLRWRCWLDCLQELGEKACAAYLRSVFLQPNKAVFDVTALPVAEFGLSMGLSSVPQLRFMRQAARQKQAGCKPQSITQTNGHGRPQEASRRSQTGADGAPEDRAVLPGWSTVACPLPACTGKPDTPDILFYAQHSSKLLRAPGES